MDSNNYVFISYAHKDSHIVQSFIQSLKNNNISVWYDQGIQAGSEWPEYIAQKVVSCTKFVLFISKSYLESQNCKRELNFAISRKKEILSVFIEDVELSPGMEMQLGTYQAIYRNRFKSDAEFSSSLCGEPFFDDCKTGNASFSSYAATQKSTFTKSTPHTSSNKKNRFVAALLAFFLGMFGIQKFYLNDKRKGILSIAFFWTYVPFFIGLYDCAVLLFSSKDKLEKKYNCIFK